MDAADLGRRLVGSGLAVPMCLTPMYQAPPTLRLDYGALGYVCLHVTSAYDDLPSVRIYGTLGESGSGDTATADLRARILALGVAIDGQVAP